MTKLRSFADLARMGGALPVSSSANESSNHAERVRAVRAEILTLLNSGKAFTATEIMRRLNERSMPLRGPALATAVNNLLPQLQALKMLTVEVNAGFTYYKKAVAPSEPEATILSFPTPTPKAMAQETTHDIEKLDQAIWDATRDRKPRTAQAIAMILEDKGYRKDVVRDRVYTLYRHGTWFDRIERGEDTYYSMKKTCKSPQGSLPVKPKEPIPEFAPPVGKPVEFPPNTAMAEALKEATEKDAPLPEETKPSSEPEAPVQEPVLVKDTPLASQAEETSYPDTLFTLKTTDQWPVMIIKCLADRKWQGTGDIIKTLEHAVGFNKPKNGTNVYNHISVMKRSGILEYAPGERGHLYRISPAFDIIKYLESNGMRTLAMCMKEVGRAASASDDAPLVPTAPSVKPTPTQTTAMASVVEEPRANAPLLSISFMIKGVAFTLKEVRAFLPTLIDLAADEQEPDDGEILVMERIVRVKGVEFNSKQAKELLVALKENGFE